MYITKILGKIRPGAKWKMCNEDYNQLEWYETVQTKPTLAEIEAAEAGVLADIAAEQAEKQAIANAIATKLPSLAEINAKINKLPLDEATKAFLVDLTEVVYHHIKGATNGS